MKKTLSSLDYVKLLFAVVVVAIHTELFVNYKTGNILFTSFFAESAVPFFFIVSGFFIGSKYRNSNNSFKVIFNATKKYGIIAIVWGSWYTILSILVNIFKADFRNPVAIIKNSITKSLLGSPGGGTWYIVALFWECLCLSILARVIDLNKRKKIILISCFLFYIIPYMWWIDFDIFNCIRTMYNSYFTGKTLFVFFLIYVIYGFYFNCDSLVRLKERNKKICQICLGLLIISVGGGKIFINFSLYRIEGLAFFNGIIALLYNVLIFCFVMCLNNNDSENHKLKAKICRNCSTIIYFSHYTIICGVKLLLQVLGMNSLANNNVFVFILVMLLCMFVCLIVLKSTTMKKLYFIS